MGIDSLLQTCIPPYMSPMSDARHYEYTLKSPGSSVCQNRRSSPYHLHMGRNPLRYTVRLGECLHQQLVSSDKHQFPALYRLLNCSLNTTQPWIRVRLTTCSRSCRWHTLAYLTLPPRSLSYMIIMSEYYVWEVCWVDKKWKRRNGRAITLASCTQKLCAL